MGEQAKYLVRDLLDWYDRNARELPWRTSPAARKTGVMPDPYHVWLSEIMLQQTTVAAVASYFRRFLILWPTIEDLAAAEDSEVMGEWAGLGYYARVRNLLKCARIVANELDGRMPQTLDGLIALPGIGPYTAAAIAAIAFDRPETVMDGNVERVMARLHAVETPLPAAKPKLFELASRLTPTERPGDYAQAVMDLGATICTPKSPSCGKCPWRAACAARAEGIAGNLPSRTAKPAKPVRHGFVYAARRPDGALLLERRPARGLLGGMLGFPGSDWTDQPMPVPPVAADWRGIGEVRHTFTHFHLRLTVLIAVTDASPDRGAFMPPDEVRRETLPTLMRKVLDLASPEFAAVPD